MKSLVITFIVGLILGIAGGFVVLNHPPKAGNVITQGIVPQVATSSLVSVGPSNSTTLFTKNSGCASRIITTYANPIMLSFTSSLTPTALVGHLQAASTTVAYDNGVYGCGQVSAYGYAASTSITVTGLSQ